MSDSTFQALVLEDSDGAVTPSIQCLDDSRLPEGDTVVRVAYSTLNFKDGMIVKGLGKLVRQYPHVPGIDFAGTVESSQSDRFKPGDPVILTGYRVGEVHWGGFATRARVQADWLVPLPDGLSLAESMAIGTAGFTAMLAVMALEAHGLTPDPERDVLVTGAAGGVGSLAVALLAALGYRVAASTGRPQAEPYLKSMGAASIVGREDLATPPAGPLGAQRWAAAIDNVGGPILANLLASLGHGGSCACVGLAAGPGFQASVLPFVLRGINLLGIDSNLCPMDRRRLAWSRLARELPKDKLAAATSTATLPDVPDLAGRILGGEVQGRTVIRLED